MATRTTRKKTTAEPATAEVVASTVETEAQEIQGEETSETVAIACRLPLGIKFDDVPNGSGGTKVIEFPGINRSLRGKSEGILLAGSGALCVSILRKDWEAIVAMHGRETAFTGKDGLPPCIWEMGTVADFKARADEVAEMRHGLEPIVPEEIGVTEAKQTGV